MSSSLMPAQSFNTSKFFCGTEPSSDVDKKLRESGPDLSSLSQNKRNNFSFSKGKALLLFSGASKTTNRMVQEHKFIYNCTSFIPKATLYNIMNSHFPSGITISLFQNPSATFRDNLDTFHYKEVSKFQ